MKNSLITLLILFFSFSAYSLNIRLYGKAGVVVKGNKVKVCPSITFNCCAIITVTWKDVKDYIDGAIPSIPAVTSIVGGENINSQIIILDSSPFEESNQNTIDLYEDDVIEIIKQ